MKKSNIAPAAKLLGGQNETIATAKELSSFDAIALGGAEGRTIAHGERIVFLPISEYEGEKTKDNVMTSKRKAANGRVYESAILKVIAYNVDGNGEPVNVHFKWFNPTSMLKRDFPVTVIPAEGERTVKQAGLRSKFVDCKFNEEFSGWRLPAIIRHLVENNLALVGEMSSTKVWLGYWENGNRVPDTFILDNYVEVSTEDAAAFED